MNKMVLIYLWLFALAISASAQSIEVGFAAHGHDPSAHDLVLKIIASAKTEIRVACYNFTDKSVVRALNAAVQRGVDVEIVHDAVAASEKGDATQAIQAGGGHIRLDHRYKIMHDKFIIVDRTSVETGSYNYTVNANRENAENALVVWNDPITARKYLEVWTRLWNESR